MVYLSSHKLTKDQRDNLAREYDKGASRSELCSKYGVTKSTVAELVIARGYKVRGNEYNRTFNINKSFFDSFDNEYQAYWLGWILSDGHHNRDKHMIKIELGIQDIEILEKLNSAVDSSRPIKIREPRGVQKQQTASLTVNCKQWSDRLFELGIYGNKTHSIKFPAWLPENLVPHFIRGHQDGDGTITFRNYPQYNRIDGYWKICGTYDLCSGVKDVLVKNGIPANVYRHSKNSPTWYVQVSGNQHILMLKEYLYSDSHICLERKYERFCEIKKQDEQFKYDKEHKPELKCSICDNKRYKHGYCHHHWYELSGGKEKCHAKYLRQRAKKKAQEAS
ncbi:MAG: hypothetical protein Q8910_00340 [Bacteroidota bacterium]|nr:hypothetical protein [Bacteroidota bacterium]